MTTLTTEKTTTIEEFCQELLTDSTIQERLKTVTNPESFSALVVELAQENGYSLTKEEVLAAMAVEAAMGGEYLEIGDPLQETEGPIARCCCCGRCRSPQ